MSAVGFLYEDLVMEVLAHSVKVALKLCSMVTLNTAFFCFFFRSASCCMVHFSVEEPVMRQDIQSHRLYMGLWLWVLPLTIAVRDLRVFQERNEEFLLMIGRELLMRSQYTRWRRRFASCGFYRLSYRPLQRLLE